MVKILVPAVSQGSGLQLAERYLTPAAYQAFLACRVSYRRANHMVTSHSDLASPQPI
jgi:hypothetical protein